jgi:hypothetical protein
LYAEEETQNKYFERDAAASTGGNWDASGGEIDSGQAVETSQAQEVVVGFEPSVILEFLRVVGN